MTERGVHTLDSFLACPRLLNIPQPPRGVAGNLTFHFTCEDTEMQANT